MFKITGTTIEVTRGNKMVVDFSIKDYIFKPNDVIRLSICESGDYENVLLRKDIVVPSESEVVPINLSAEETKFGDFISEEREYWYEIELNPDTINTETPIGHDKSGAKLFILYPETKGVEE